ncbi:hypothetical protein LAZ67_3004921 [Cordylochernes scorpioides]|uniref:Ankyrin repeat protein n=1 Tax=Cordylochernes scorpioides TaxID=51811 RepID=A0ABY6K9X2_9ARAC|nr:hypothetical protein LAZ67_3004921 [Cordylochernes scorpioides]
MFQDLIEAGAEYNTKSVGGVTPLMMAASKDDERLIIHLLKFGVDLEDADMNGETAIFYTVNRHFKNLKILFEAGAEINRKNETELIKGPRETPSAMNSKLGWIISGRSKMSNSSTSTSFQQIHINHSTAELDDIVRKFWDSESIPAHKEELNTEELE